jgi:hypothetical protein
LRNYQAKSPECGKDRIKLNLAKHCAGNSDASYPTGLAGDHQFFHSAFNLPLDSGHSMRILNTASASLLLAAETKSISFDKMSL